MNDRNLESLKSTLVEAHQIWYDPLEPQFGVIYKELLKEYEEEMKRLVVTDRPRVTDLKAQLDKEVESQCSILSVLFDLSLEGQEVSEQLRPLAARVLRLLDQQALVNRCL